VENQAPNKPEWKRRKYNTLDGQVASEYVKGNCVIEARASGVICKNVDLEGYSDLQDFAKMLSLAWKDHEALKGAILNKLMGKH
jgi:hypothetical protein